MNIKRIIIVMLMAILFAVSGYSLDKSAEQLTVTYVGSAGFLLDTGSKKVLLDAVFTADGAKGFITPSAKTISNIAGSTAPFDNIDLFLVSHAHEDHVDAAMLDKCIVTNQKAKLICPQEVVDAILKISGNSYNSYKDRVIVPALNDFESIDNNVNGIEVKTTKFPLYNYHPVGILVFNIKLNNIALFYILGAVSDQANYKEKPFNDKNNDILLVSSSYLDNTPVVFKSILFYKIALVEHIYNYQTVLDKYIERCDQMTDDSRKVYALRSSLEKHKITKTKDVLKIDNVVVK